MQGPFYCLTLHYRANAADPLTQNAEGGDRHFMTCADPVPNLATACRMAWFVMGKYGGDYGLLYFEDAPELLQDDGPELFKPRYRLTAPNRDYGSLETL